MLCSGTAMTKPFRNSTILIDDVRRDRRGDDFWQHSGYLWSQPVGKVASEIFTLSLCCVKCCTIEDFFLNFKHQIAVSSTYLFRYLTLRLWSLPINYISNLDNYRVVVMEKCQNEVADDVTGELDNMAPITQTLCLLTIDGGWNSFPELIGKDLFTMNITLNIY